MKNWQKIAIGCALLFLVSACAIVGITIGLGGYGFKTLMDAVTNPDVMLKNAQEVCEFDLPNGYEVAFAMNVMGVQIAAIGYKNSPQVILLLSLPENNRIKAADFEKELAKGSKEEIIQLINSKSSSSDTKVTKINDKGIYKLNGHKIPFCKAEFEREGKLSDGIIAIYECPETKKNFIVMAISDKGTYKDNITMGFLKNLRCHKK